MNKKKAQIDYTKLKLAGCTSAIEEIVKGVFRPRKFPSNMCREIGKCHLFDDHIISNMCFIEMQYVRGVILHGPPGTGKTSIILYVFQSSFYLVNICKFIL